MNKILRYLFFIPVVAGAFHACHKLDVAPKAEISSSAFPQTEAQFQAVIGPLYTQLRSSYALDYWFVQSCSSDEAILPAYGGNWYDGGKYVELHLHTWTKDNAWLNSAYAYASNLIGLCNQTIYILKDAPAGSVKNRSVAQVRAMRALGYWMLMDMYGNVPLDTAYGDTQLKTNATRSQVFSYVEGELKNVLSDLPTTVGASTYGKPTRYMAWSLLAKMYLNAEVYTGTARNNECIAVCDSIINAASYSLQPRASYLSQFAPTNGASMPEFIFAIPYDPTTSNGYLFHARYDLNRNLGMKYKYQGSTVGTNVSPIVNKTTGNGLINSKPSGPRATLPSFLKYFDDANDIRNKQWLGGYQYWDDGSPIMVQTTKKGYDSKYTGTDGTSEYIYHLFLDTTITLRADPATLDLGNDELAWNMGVRNIKFLADYNNATSRNQSNDAPIFRYSDILLMKAEAILRGGSATGGQTPLTLVNALRAQRTTSAAWTSVTLEDLYKERSREFTWECWHRNDMIRFGKFEDSYGFKTNKDTYRRIFPIPTDQLSTNNKLKQNTGY